MFRPRVIPCLLLKGKGLVKTIKFKDPTYLGDPINAVRIFNEKETDELVFLDITATKETRAPYIDVIKRIGDECFMPFAVGGGIRSLETIRQLFNAGAEKVVINSYAEENPAFIQEAAAIFGKQSIIVSIDVRKKFGHYRIYTVNGTKVSKYKLIEYTKLVAAYGAGEILINSIDRDGTYTGYELEVISAVSREVDIPVIACGGAGSLNDLSDAIKIGEASAVAAGSLFVFHGRKRAVLINYPTKDELAAYFYHNEKKR
jgi:cyclase